MKSRKFRRGDLVMLNPLLNQETKEHLRSYFYAYLCNRQIYSIYGDVDIFDLVFIYTSSNRVKLNEEVNLMLDDHELIYFLEYVNGEKVEGKVSTSIATMREML